MVVMEDVNPFALEPEQVEMIRAGFYFILIAVAVYIFSSMVIKLIFRAFVIDHYILNDEQQAKYKTTFRPTIDPNKYDPKVLE
jgi:hypothetical protein